MNEFWESITRVSDQACRSAFGETVIYHYGRGENDEVRGLLSSVHVEIDSISHAPISTQNCSVDLRRSDLKREPRTNDKLTVRETLYRVIDIQNDMHGGVKLILMKGDGA